MDTEENIYQYFKVTFCIHIYLSILENRPNKNSFNRFFFKKQEIFTVLMETDCHNNEPTVPEVSTIMKGTRQ